MSKKCQFEAVFPIGDTDPRNLPVADLDRAIDYYQKHLGFTLRSRSASPYQAALLVRDGVEIRLAENGKDPEQASCYMDVNDVALAFEELQDQGLEVSEIQTQEYSGTTYRVFFLRDPDGLCYCIGQPA
jgi:catechol 2,3-dioxygenase-like lactoylglutathione lyase family enzyme